MIHTCEYCAFSTTVSSNYKRHLLSKKHMKQNQTKPKQQKSRPQYKEEQADYPNMIQLIMEKLNSKEKELNQNHSQNHSQNQNHNKSQITAMFDIIRHRIQM